MGNGFYRSKDPTNSIKVLTGYLDYFLHYYMLKDSVIILQDNLTCRLHIGNNA